LSKKQKALTMRLLMLNVFVATVFAANKCATNDELVKSNGEKYALKFKYSKNVSKSTKFDGTSIGFNESSTKDQSNREYLITDEDTKFMIRGDAKRNGFQIFSEDENIILAYNMNFFGSYGYYMYRTESYDWSNSYTKNTFFVFNTENRLYHDPYTTGLGNRNWKFPLRVEPKMIDTTIHRINYKVDFKKFHGEYEQNNFTDSEQLGFDALLLIGQQIGARNQYDRKDLTRFCFLKIEKEDPVSVCDKNAEEVPKNQFFREKESDEKDTTKESTNASTVKGELDVEKQENTNVNTESALNEENHRVDAEKVESKDKVEHIEQKKPAKISESSIPIWAWVLIPISAVLFLISIVACCGGFEGCCYCARKVQNEDEFAGREKILKKKKRNLDYLTRDLNINVNQEDFGTNSSLFTDEDLEKVHADFYGIRHMQNELKIFGWHILIRLFYL
jgi:hypothetical protein